MKALGYFILVDELKEDIKETQGGLLLAEKHREDTRYRRGIVRSLGASVEGLNEGETIWFDRAAGHNVEFANGDILKVVRGVDVVIVE